MENTKIEKSFETWKPILFIDIGAVLILLLTTIIDLFEKPGDYSSGWFGIWFFIFLATFLPGFVLLFGKTYMQIPIRERLNTVFGYFLMTWFTLLSIGIRTTFFESEFIFYSLMALVVIIGIVYWYMRHKIRNVKEEIFP